MPVVKFADPGGNQIKLQDVGEDFWVPTIGNPDMTDAYFPKIPSLKCRDDDIFLVNYPKSGTHWIWEVINMLINGNAESIPEAKVTMMMEFYIYAKVHDSVPSPRVINTHLRFRNLPKDAVERKCKLVFTVRNPKDVAVSHYNHVRGMTPIYDYHGSWDNFLSLWLEGHVDYGSWFDYNLDWEKMMTDNPDMPILLVHYEDMKEDSFREIKRIAEFLEMKHDESLYKTIADKCQISNMKKDKKHTEDTEDMKRIRNADFSLFRKGEVGDWKNWFTVAQSEAFDAVYKKRMEHSNWKLRYTI